MLILCNIWLNILVPFYLIVYFLTIPCFSNKYFLTFWRFIWPCLPFVHLLTFLPLTGNVWWLAAITTLNKSSLVGLRRWVFLNLFNSILYFLFALAMFFLEIPGVLLLRLPVRLLVLMGLLNLNNLFSQFNIPILLSSHQFLCCLWKSLFLMSICIELIKNPGKTQWLAP